MIGIPKRIQSYYQDLQKEHGQATMQGMLALILLVFVVFTVGDEVLSNTSISKENNSLTDTALNTLLPVILIAAAIGIVLRLF